MKTTILASKDSMKWLLCRFALLFIPLALAWFALSPKAEGQLSPPPDGCYPNYTTAEGCNALAGLTSGQGNTGIGWYALFEAAASNFNTGVGGGALALNTGDSNTAVGAAALLLNTSGIVNTAVGTDALVFNDTGVENNAFGAFALFSNTIGNFNNAHGHEALEANVDGIENQAFGDEALLANVSGSGNIAIGDSALIDSTGDNNVAVGKSAGHLLTVANNVIAIGSGVSGVDTVLGEVDDSCYIGNIYTGTVPAAGNPLIVFVDPDGKFGTQTVDADGNTYELPASALQSFMRQGGQAVPQRHASAAKQAKKQAMLYRQVEELQATVAKLTQQLKEQAEQIQKVSAQLELNKPSPRTVRNDN